MPDPNDAPRAQEIEEIYRALVKGLGHERVNDDNVFALIRRAEADGQTVLAQTLREWQAPCGPGTPATGAPNPGFNRENAKH
ncbi:MAG TPA: hypothetical protein PK177_04505 [Burkholderiaceae bacterium]|nr:hypothetical protein [Burkholderiaceae bacterium]